MLRQVALEVEMENRLQDSAREHGVKLSLVDCKQFNKTGISLLMELRGDSKAIRETLAEIRKVEGIRQVIPGEDSGESVPLLVVMDRPATCRASSDAAIICLECPLNSDKQPASWRFIVRKTTDLGQILTKLSHDGVGTRIEDVSPLNQKPSLTGRQKEIVATAVAHGYFEFPRKISLTDLSNLVGVKPSTLSEILRGAERRIMETALAGAFQEN